jgi:hypothetical protein
MERSEGVSVVLTHIMKMIDRRGERMLQRFSRNADARIRLRSTSRTPEPEGSLRGSPNVADASATAGPLTAIETGAAYSPQNPAPSRRGGV